MTHSFLSADRDDDAMDVDEQEDNEEALGEDDSDDENEEDPSDVAMVPVADMLNARYESENVGLTRYSRIEIT